MNKHPDDSLDAYTDFLAGVSTLLESSRHKTARAVNAAMTTTYWEIGRRLVEFEQRGASRAQYGQEIAHTLSIDLTERFGRGFSQRNLNSMRKFYLSWQDPIIDVKHHEEDGSEIWQTVSAKFDSRPTFELPWSHYVNLLGVKDVAARQFYEREALAGGWTIRQLKRQIGTRFFERAALSKDKEKMLVKGGTARPSDQSTTRDEIRDPLILEFLDLKDEYSESDLEDALIHHLESFLLELGGDFTFVGRQKRLRIDEVWFRVDLVFYHRRLRCLVIVDLKLVEFTHADVGQMNLYLNYARRHWTRGEENPPVGLILCAAKRRALAEYALEGISNEMLVAEYKTCLPEVGLLEAELEGMRARLERRACRHREPHPPDEDREG